MHIVHLNGPLSRCSVLRSIPELVANLVFQLDYGVQRCQRGSYVLDLTFLRETTSLNVTLSPSSSLKNYQRLTTFVICDAGLT
jgi:hypothetical protein